MKSEIDYISARLRARKSRLLGGDVLRGLTRLSTVEEFVKNLADTVYSAPISLITMQEGEQFGSVFKALGKALEDDISHIRSFSESMGTTPCHSLFAIWDVENLKRVFRGLKSHEPVESTMQAIVAAGWVENAVWREIAGSDTLREGAERALSMGVIPRSVIREGIADKRFDSDELTSLEMAVDRWFFSSALGWFGSNCSREFWEPVKSSIRLSLDARNIRAIIEGLSWGELPKSGNIIPGGKYEPSKLLRRVAAAQNRPSEMAAVIRESFKGGGEQSAVFLEEGDLPAAVESLNLAGWRRQIAFLGGDPLSSTILVGYLWAKIAELVDLRRILGGIEFGISANFYTAALITV